MTTALILSKDRAAQCDLLLRSMSKHYYFNEIVVLFTHSDKHTESYDILRSEHKEAVFVRQDGAVYDDFKTIISGISDYATCILTDDTVFFKQADALLPNKTLKDCPDIFCFSLRLGFNTIVQDYTTGRKQAELNPLHYSGFVKWNYNEYPQLDNYGYPPGMDGVVYRTKDLQEINKSLKISNLREWEGQLATSKRYLYSSMPMMASYHNSICVNIPANAVLGGLHHSKNAEFTLDRALALYMEGKRIDKMDFSNVVGCHQEIKYEWS